MNFTNTKNQIQTNKVWEFCDDKSLLSFEETFKSQIDRKLLIRLSLIQMTLFDLFIWHEIPHEKTKHILGRYENTYGTMIDFILERNITNTLKRQLEILEKMTYEEVSAIFINTTAFNWNSFKTEAIDKFKYNLFFIELIRRSKNPILFEIEPYCNNEFILSLIISVDKK